MSIAAVRSRSWTAARRATSSGDFQVRHVGVPPDGARRRARRVEQHAPMHAAPVARLRPSALTVWTLSAMRRRFEFIRSSRRGDRSSAIMSAPPDASWAVFAAGRCTQVDHVLARDIAEQARGDRRRGVPEPTTPPRNSRVGWQWHRRQSAGSWPVGSRDASSRSAPARHVSARGNVRAAPSRRMHLGNPPALGPRHRQHSTNSINHFGVLRRGRIV